MTSDGRTPETSNTGTTTETATGTGRGRGRGRGTDWHPTGPQTLTRHFRHITRRARDLDHRHPLLWDLLVTGFFVTAALIDYTSGGWGNIAANPALPGRLIFTLSLGLTLPLLLRRTHP